MTRREDAAAVRTANIARLLAPRSIVFIGGRHLERPIDSCRRIGFLGDMWVVSPQRQSLAGLPCYASLADLPDVPDAAFLAVSAEKSAAVVGELAALGVGGVVCYAAGFAEMGPQGQRLQEDLVAAAGDMALLGPNCYGLLNYLDGAALWADAHGGEALEDGVAIISQSGNISLNLTMTERSVPLAQVIAVGNQAALGVGDFVEPLLADPRIKAIGIYLEGLDNIATFSRSALAALEKGVPIVVLKVGRSADATRIAASHTASLAGEDALYDCLFERLGILRVPSLTAFMETLKALACYGPLAGNRLGVLTCSGGDAALLADLAEREGLVIPPLSAGQVATISGEVTAITTVANPLDYNTAIWGQREKLESCFAAVMAEGTDATLLVIDYARDGLPGYADWDTAVDALIVASAKTGGLGVALSTFPELLPNSVRQRLIAAGLLPLQGLEDAITALGQALSYGKRRRQLLQRGDTAGLALPALHPPGPAAPFLDEVSSKTALAAFGLPVPDRRVVAASDAVAAAEALGFPVVVKALAPDLIHKSDAGGVALGLQSPAAVRAAVEAMTPLTAEFLIEAQVSDTVAEVIIGVKRDPVMGLALVLGSGGVLANLVADSARLLLPTDRDEVLRALGSLKVMRLLSDTAANPPATWRPLPRRSWPFKPMPCPRKKGSWSWMSIRSWSCRKDKVSWRSMRSSA